MSWISSRGISAAGMGNGIQNTIAQSEVGKTKHRYYGTNCHPHSKLLGSKISQRQRYGEISMVRSAVVAFAVAAVTLVHAIWRCRSFARPSSVAVSNGLRRSRQKISRAFTGNMLLPIVNYA